jgi:tetratricopeptide (TPR) repeat protein
MNIQYTTYRIGQPTATIYHQLIFIAFKLHSMKIINPILIELTANDDVKYNNKGSLLNDLRSYEEVLNEYDKAIEIDPNFAPAYSNKGHVLSCCKEKKMF